MSIPQQTVNYDPAPGVAGDFCSTNPRHSMLAGPGAFVAGAAGVLVGRFAWAKDDGTVGNAHPGVASSIGFVHRNQPALITTWLAQFGNTVQPGLGLTLFDGGDFWMAFAGGATKRQKVFANYADGTAVAGTAGSPPTGSAVTVTNTSGQPTLTVTAGTVPAPGSPLAGTGVPAGAYVVSVAGNVVTMSANSTAAVSSVTPTTAFETNWYVDQTVNAGEIAKTSTRG